MNKKNRSNIGRGKVVSVTLKKEIKFNSNIIKKAVIEIDHINHGLDMETGTLKNKKRTNFSIKDIEKFILSLDGEDLIPDRYKGKVSQFSIRIDCPVPGNFFEKEFIMIFDTHYDKPNEIHTITIFPGW